MALDISNSHSNAKDPSSLYSYFPSSSDDASDGRITLNEAEFGALRAKYAKQLASAKLALGDTVEDETILQCFEAHQGNAKKAMSELLGRSSGELRRSLQFSDALRLSASGGLSITQNNATPIDNFRKSMNLDVLGATEEVEFDFSSINKVSGESSDTDSKSTHSDTSSVITTPAATTPLAKDAEREARRQLLLARKKEKDDLKKAQEQQQSQQSQQQASKSTTATLDTVMTAIKREESDQRKADLNLAPWPVDTRPPVVEAPVVEKRSAPRIIDKSQLGEEETHDANALLAFLTRRLPSATKIAAAEQIKRISTDEFVVISRQARKLRLLHTSRHRAIIAAGIADKPQDTLASKKAREKAALDGQSLKDSILLSASLSNGVVSPSEAPLTYLAEAASPFSMLDLSGDLNALREKGMISSLAETIKSCQQSQIDELAQLESILTSERCAVAECTPRVVAFSLMEPLYQNSRDPSGEPVRFRLPLMLQLVVILPATYPELSPPVITIRSSTPRCPITNFSRLEQHLRDEAINLLSMPALFTLQQSAESWLNEDPEMQQLAESTFFKNKLSSAQKELRASTTAPLTQDQTIPGTTSGHLAVPALYTGLRAIFNETLPEFELRFHRFEDILFRRNRILLQATTFIIKCYDAIEIENPVVVEKRKMNHRFEFPVLNLTGDLDITSSLAAIHLNQSKVRQLLEKFQWDMQTMSAAFLESLSSVKDYITFLTSNGLEVDDSSSSERQISLEEEIECPICFCDFSRHQGFALSCGHYACIDCYCEYANVHVSSGSASALTCTACPTPFDPLALCALLSSRRWSTFCNATVSGQVASATALKWCPSSKPCDFIVQFDHMSDLGSHVKSKQDLLAEDDRERSLASASSLQSKNPLSSNVSSVPVSSATSAGSLASGSAIEHPALVQCKCEHVYCAGCQTVGSHLPMTCEEQKRWRKMFPDDMRGGVDEAEEETRRMLEKITRSCPRCGVHISKSGGCPHMSCMSCNHQFCWVCFANWETSHYACNQASVGGNISTEASGGSVVPGSASLLIKHRNAGYDLGVTIMANSVVSSLYTLDDRIHAEIHAEKIKNGLLSPSSPAPSIARAPERIIYGQIRKDRNFAAPPKYLSEEALTFSDIDFFISSAELMQLAHYLTTNSIKLIIMLNASGDINVNRNSATYRTFNRVISDLIHLSDHFKHENYSKILLWHVQNADKALRVSLKLMLEHVEQIRDSLA